MNKIEKVIIFFIVLYQKILSPDHGPYSLLFPHGFCRYHPTCSEYMIRCIRLYGVGKGLSLGIKRVLRCHPWAEPKVDLPESQGENKY